MNIRQRERHGISRVVAMTVCVCAGISSLCFAKTSDRPDHWMVATGQGGCSAVTSITGELRDLPNWGGPEDFVNSLRAKGVQVSTVTGEYEGRYMVKVVVPSRGVDVVFVPYSLCRKMWKEEIERFSRQGSGR